MKHKIDPEGSRLPIKLDATSNGESSRCRFRLRTSLRTAPLMRRLPERQTYRQEPARFSDLGLRRGVHTAGIHRANAAAGKLGGFFDLESEAALEPQLAQARVGGQGEFILDVQGHFVDPTGAWVKNAPAEAFKWSPKPAARWRANPASAVT